MISQLHLGQNKKQSEVALFRFGVSLMAVTCTEIRNQKSSADGYCVSAAEKKAHPAYAPVMSDASLRRCTTSRPADAQG